ncbi:MAG: energy transducer TonB, partial [Gammaproteobacteria bacterium]
ESEARQKPETNEKEAASASTFVQADSRPYALDNPKPVYPSVARRRGMQGLVLLQVRVSEEGKVTGIHVVRSSGFRILDVVAVDSVKQWRFMPARENDMTVTSTVQVPVRFSLNN